MSKAYRTTYHRDGTVTLWDVYRQMWRRMKAANVPDQIMASLSVVERARIERMAAKTA